MNYIEVSGRSVDDAIIKASMELETPSDKLDIQIISEGSSGFLGFGSKPAIIKVRRKTDEEINQEEKSAKKSEEAVKITKADKTEEIIKTEEPTVSKTTEGISDIHKKEVKSNEEERYIRREREIEVIIDPDEIKKVEELARGFLNNVFKAMPLEVEIKSIYNAEDKCLEVEFIGEDMGLLIGKRGQTLDSLQYLTSLVVNKGRSKYLRVKLDTEDYRNRRKTTLENLAKGIAYKVRKNHKPVILEPMNPYERRIIHSTLQNNKYVETFSEGEEPYRHVVVKMKNYRK